MTTIASLSDDAAEILEPNLPFFRTDPDDKGRYMVGPAALEAIAWMATTIVLPLLMVGLSEVVKTYVKKWMENKELDVPLAPPPDAVLGEINDLLASSSQLNLSEAQTAVAVKVVADYLAYRGWPATFASADATAIVNTIKGKIGMMA
ncbi:hypothetical protein [Pseudoduganella lutea]|uniref:Uncharacterized protein n=1 Tax=Pseudoduganella lutea TaxID=321985 RepID=A0A4P6L4E7_9BURK|nr:hypothetical protein [Pseudoduganella lutea]QBE66304.1 hypothetical protein EWM63_27745 [Pseudoduganella lutea]